MIGVVRSLTNQLQRPYSGTEYAPVEDPFQTPTPSASAPTDSPAMSSDASASTADVAKGEAATVKDTAVEAGQNVAATAKGEATTVVAETKQQAKSLFGSVTSEVRDQASAQQQKIATSVQSLSQELTGMASSSSESGPLTDLAHQAAQKGGELAHWLENREPADVLQEVRSFARRRPVMFLALCGAAGVVAGRLTRGAVAANTSVDSPSVDHRSTPPAVETRRAASLQEMPAAPVYDGVLAATPAPSAPEPGFGDRLGDDGFGADRSGGMR